jgi:7,8-dihydropterin-6-yl-methyl-4-(beta-D-ribofuranosyl)aminobenzene 5'-phosphate synthase
MYQKFVRALGLFFAFFLFLLQTSFASQNPDKMELTVLVDNNTLIDQYYIGEPGVSYYIKIGEYYILFDTGYSDAFIKNANLMNIDLQHITHLVLSHGHQDHTWGIPDWMRKYSAKIEKKPTLIAHYKVFNRKVFYNSNTKVTEEIGMNISLDTLRQYFNIKTTKTPCLITKDLIFLGEIKRVNNFENKSPEGKVQETSGKLKDDYCLDDSALVYNASEGLVTITGCSHSGICNIVEYAKKVGIKTWNKDKVISIIGGLHLQNASETVLNQTAKHLSKHNIQKVYACHCTDLKAKNALSKKGINRPIAKVKN